VVGVPHPDLIEAPRAFVVLQDHSVKAVDLKNLVAEKLFIANQLQGGVVFLEQLPKTPLGKIARSELRKMSKSLPDSE